MSRNPKGDAVVMMVGADEKVEAHPINVARTIGDSWLVSGGLKAGDRVILDGLQKARPGSPVSCSLCERIGSVFRWSVPTVGKK